MYLGSCNFTTGGEWNQNNLRPYESLSYPRQVSGHSASSIACSPSKYSKSAEAYQASRGRLLHHLESVADESRLPAVPILPPTTGASSAECEISKPMIETHFRAAWLL